VLTANIAGGEHSREFVTLTEALTYGRHLQKQPATISFQIERAEPSGFVVEKKWQRSGGRMLGMNLWRVDKKLREAEFFYMQLLKHEKVLIGDKEPFGFYLSAFLTAGKSVRENKKWRTDWDNKHTPEEKSLIDYMADDRDKEVHTTGSRHNVGQEGVEFGIGTHRTTEGTITIDSPPGMPPSIAYRPTYSFTIDGVDRKVAEACGAYLALRQRMIAEFKAVFP
jgi:hypothetical protein